MARNRIIWGILWILSLVGISFYGGPISYGFFTMVTILPIVSLVYLLCVNFFFRIYQKLDTNRPVAGQGVPFYFTLMNEYFFGFSGIRVRFFSTFSSINGLDDDIEYELQPKTGIEKQTELICKYRGEYEVGVKTLVIQDFLRLFKISYHNPETLRVVVRPQLIYLDELKCLEESPVILEETSAGGENLDVLTREYVPGDDIRQIHWAQAAKTGMLMVREKTGEKQQGIGILMGTERFGKKPEDYLKTENKMIECTLALALYFTGKNIAVQHMHLHLSDGLVTRSVTDMSGFEEYYELLSDVTFEAGQTEEKLAEYSVRMPSLLTRKAVFVVIHTVSAKVRNLIRLLNDNNVYVIVYLIKDTTDYPVKDENLPRAFFYTISPDDDLKEVM